MKASNYIGGRYLNVTRLREMKAEDCKVGIDHCEAKIIAGEEKLVLHLVDTELPLALGTEQIEQLIEIIGSDDTDDWRGVVVQLYVDENVRFQGKRVGGIRIRPVE